MDRPFSGSTFDQIYERFVERQGWALLRSRKEEGYKDTIAGQAYERLSHSHWTAKMVGTGQIRDRVVSAIEIPGNNLLKWDASRGPESRVHHRMIDASADDLVVVEQALYDLYREGSRTEAVFETLCDHLGRKFELLAYLFFCADDKNYLPIRTNTLDRFFSLLGVNLKTSRRCTWKTYLVYNDVMRCVHKELLMKLAPVTFLEAHSFAWMVAQDKGEVPAQPEVQIVPFSGTLLNARTRGDRSDIGEVFAESDAMEAFRKRVGAGQKAEEAVLDGERSRLAHAGRLDLADLVSNDPAKNPAIGYDILSYEANGTEKHIEVKNVTSSPRFYVSANEWAKSQQDELYCFYLVEFGKELTKIQELSPKEIQESHLRVASYEVAFRRPL